MAIRAREYTHNKAIRVLVKAHPSGFLPRPVTTASDKTRRPCHALQHFALSYFASSAQGNDNFTATLYKGTAERLPVWKRVTVGAGILPWSEAVSCQSLSMLRVFLPAIGPQSMKKNQTPASQSALRTTRHGAGPHGHPPGPSDPHLHGESVTGHPAVSRSELSINARWAGPTDISRNSVLVCSYIKQPNTKL